MCSLFLLMHIHIRARTREFSVSCARKVTYAYSHSRTSHVVRQAHKVKCIKI